MSFSIDEIFQGIIWDHFDRGCHDIPRAFFLSSF